MEGVIKAPGSRLAILFISKWQLKWKRIKTAIDEIVSKR